MTKPENRTPAVLLLAFNRPDLLRRVFLQVRAARPPKLFLAVDGARADRPGEAELCEQCRALAREVDWPCEVNTRFPSGNAGCKAGVSGAISWFFEHVEEGIILEDDCLPHPSFFPYCAALLALYRNDVRVGLISGNNFFPEDEWRGEGHDFSLFTFIWGWATWRRAWSRFDGRLLDWPRLRRTSWLAGLLGGEHGARAWSPFWDRCYSGKLDSWAFPWSYSCWRAGFLSVVPACNLVTNIGFDGRGTHTTDANSRNANLQIREIAIPDRAAPVARNVAGDARLLKIVYSIDTSGGRKKRRLKDRWRAWRGRLALALDACLLHVSGRRSRRRRTLRLLAANDSPTGGEARLDGGTWRYLDAAAFARDYEQIFGQGIFALPGDARARRVIDCGAGAGLAAVYFKRRNPEAEVIVIESDPELRAVCEANLAHAGFGTASVREQMPARFGDLAKLVAGEPVDFLRVDARGAESDILIGQAEALKNVRQVFVEYYAGLDHRRRLPEILGALRDAGFRTHLHSTLAGNRPYAWPPEDVEPDLRVRIFATR